MDLFTKITVRGVQVWKVILASHFKYSQLENCVLCADSIWHTGTYRYIPVHIGTYQYISVHTGTYWYTSVHTGTYWYISVHTGHIGTYRYISLQVYEPKYLNWKQKLTNFTWCIPWRRKAVFTFRDKGKRSLLSAKKESGLYFPWQRKAVFTFRYKGKRSLLSVT
jgi:hypothetical protein